jgi:NTP pyrophosphatase (non-canonical NTP hydrolase)
MDFERLGFILMHSFPTLNDAWEHFGENANLDICIEECSELIKAIIKYKRYKRWKHDPKKRQAQIPYLDDIKEEIADVLICVSQLIDVFDLEMEKPITDKVNRLTMRVYDES